MREETAGLELDRKAWMIFVSIACVIFLWTFITFSGALKNDFISLDTEKYVVNNEHIRSFEWENIKWMFTKAHASNWHPLTWLSHTLDYTFFRLEPGGHHFTNIVIHSLNVTGVFVLLLFVFWPEYESRKRLFVGAGLAALLFGIHPQRVESVVWVAERKDVLCLFFSILTLIFYTYSGRIVNRRIQWRWMGASMAVFSLALMSKPMAVTLPLIMLIMDVYPLRRITISTNFRIRSDARTCLKIILEKMPFVALAAASSLLTLWAQGSEEAVMSVSIIGIKVRLINAAMTIALYLYKFLIPIGLSPNYPILPLVQLRSLLGIAAVVLLLVVISAQSVQRWRHGEEYWLVSWMIFLVSLIPVIGIFVFVGHAGAADRYTYISMIPFFSIVGFAAANMLGRSYGRYTKLVRGLGLCAMLLIIGFLTWLSSEQVKIWRSDVSLWEYVVERDPANPHSLYALGWGYQGEEDYYRAIATYQRAIRLRSEISIIKDIQKYARQGKTDTYVHIYVQLAWCYENIKDYKNAIKVYRIIMDNHFPSGGSEETLQSRIDGLERIVNQQKKVSPYTGNSKYR